MTTVQVCIGIQYFTYPCFHLDLGRSPCGWVSTFLFTDLNNAMTKIGSSVPGFGNVSR